MTNVSSMKKEQHHHHACWDPRYSLLILGRSIFMICFVKLRIYVVVCTANHRRTTSFSSKLRGLQRKNQHRYEFFASRHNIIKIFMGQPNFVRKEGYI